MTAGPLVASRLLEPISPAALLPVGAMPVTEPEAVPAAVAEAQSAQRAWGERSLEERSRLLRAVAAALLESVAEAAASIAAETGRRALLSSLYSDGARARVGQARRHRGDLAVVARRRARRR